jgi:hypothetical protein
MAKSRGEGRERPVSQINEQPNSLDLTFRLDFPFVRCGLRSVETSSGCMLAMRRARPALGVFSRAQELRRTVPPGRARVRRRSVALPSGRRRPASGCAPRRAAASAGPRSHCWPPEFCGSSALTASSTVLSMSQDPGKLAAIGYSHAAAWCDRPLTAAPQQPGFCCVHWTGAFYLAIITDLTP